MACGCGCDSAAAEQVPLAAVHRRAKWQFPLPRNWLHRETWCPSAYDSPRDTSQRVQIETGLILTHLPDTCMSHLGQ